MANIQEFMRKLQAEQESDVKYSTPAEDNIEIIPPISAPSTVEISVPDTIKVITPQEEMPRKAFKANLKPMVGNNIVSTKPVEREKHKPKTTNIPQPPSPPLPSSSENPVKPKLNFKLNINAATIREKEADNIVQHALDELFKQSGTPITKKTLWLEKYNEAKTSKKKNYVVDRMRQGKFLITENNEVLMLPDYDMTGKSSTEILRGQWLDN